MDLAEDSDERLMQQVSLGRREPLTILLQRYANSLLTFIRRVTGNHHVSEELFQEVFLAVWAGSGSYRFPRPFRAWLFGIAMNKCRIYFRKRGDWSLYDWDGAALHDSRGQSPADCAIATET